MSSDPVIHLERGRYYRADQSEIDDLLAEVTAPIQCPVCNERNADAPRLVENIDFMTSDNPEEIDLKAPYVAHIVAICKDCYMAFRKEMGMSDSVEMERQKLVALLKKMAGYKLQPIYVIPNPLCIRIKEGDVRERFYTRFQHDREKWGVEITEDHFWFARADNGVHISVFDSGYILAVTRDWSTGCDHIVHSAMVDWEDLQYLVKAIKEATPETLSFLQELLFLRCKNNNEMAGGIPIHMGNMGELLQMLGEMREGTQAPDQPTPPPSQNN